MHLTKKSHTDLTDPALMEKLQRMHPRQTQQCLGKIPLVLGMPIMITQTLMLMAALLMEAKAL
jgi:hypothetical protein